jgi:hypothetical protein
MLFPSKIDSEWFKFLPIIRLKENGNGGMPGK